MRDRRILGVHLRLEVPRGGGGHPDGRRLRHRLGQPFAPGEPHDAIVDTKPAALDDQILGSGNILARVGRDLALAPETTADIIGELARRDEAVAIHVGISGHSLAQEICEEPARLEPAGDEAGEVFLRAEQAHHVRPVDEVAEAT